MLQLDAVVNVVDGEDLPLAHHRRQAPRVVKLVEGRVFQEGDERLDGSDPPVEREGPRDAEGPPQVVGDPAVVSEADDLVIGGHGATLRRTGLHLAAYAASRKPGLRGPKPR